MDREKVIAGLTMLVDRTNDDICEELKCCKIAEDALKLLKEQETVVRCKDCRYWLPMDRFHEDFHPGKGECELNSWIRDSDWFCADGERRTN